MSGFVTTRPRFCCAGAWVERRVGEGRRRSPTRRCAESSRRGQMPLCGSVGRAWLCIRCVCAHCERCERRQRGGPRPRRTPPRRLLRPRRSCGARLALRKRGPRRRDPRGGARPRARPHLGRLQRGRLERGRLERRWRRRHCWCWSSLLSRRIRLSCALSIRPALLFSTALRTLRTLEEEEDIAENNAENNTANSVKMRIIKRRTTRQTALA